MPMHPDVAVARMAKKRKRNREFAVAMCLVIALLLAVNVAAFFLLFEDDWTPSSRIALLMAGFITATGVLISVFHRSQTTENRKGRTGK